MKITTCEKCKGDCCTAMALQIPIPRSAKDFANIRWYLYHEKTHVYIDRDGDWIAEMDLRCVNRDARTGRCKVYEKRPPVCREARLADCQRNIDDAIVRFRTMEEYDRWLKKRRGEKKPASGGDKFHFPLHYH